jgi:fucose permease
VVGLLLLGVDSISNTLHMSLLSTLLRPEQQAKTMGLVQGVNQMARLCGPALTSTVYAAVRHALRAGRHACVSNSALTSLH